MSAKSVSTESHRCLSFFIFNSLYNELLNEVHPMFIDQNTWQINTQPGNGCAGFQHHSCKKLPFSIQPYQQKSHQALFPCQGIVSAGFWFDNGTTEGIPQRETCKTKLKSPERFLVTITVK